MKLSKAYFKLVVPLFGVDVFISLTPDAYRNQTSNTKELQDEDMQGLGFCNLVSNAEGRFIVMYINMPKHNSWSSFSNTVAHESLHAAQYVIKMIGEVDGTIELPAYITGLLVEKIMEQAESYAHRWAKEKR